MDETVVPGLKLRASVIEMLMLADELGESDAAIFLNEAHMALGGVGFAPNVLQLGCDGVAPESPE